MITLPDGTFRKRIAKQWQGARSCNLGVWRGDYLAVNGFDERYFGWGREDSDLLIRLIRKEIYRKDIRFAVPVLHLWHPEYDRSRIYENNRRLEQILASDTIRATRGVDQYIKPPTVAGK